MSDPIRWADTDFAAFTAAAVAVSDALVAVQHAEAILAQRQDPVVLPVALLREAVDAVRTKLAPLMYAAADAVTVHADRKANR